MADLSRLTNTAVSHYTNEKSHWYVTKTYKRKGKIHLFQFRRVRKEIPGNCNSTNVVAPIYMNAQNQVLVHLD